MIIEVYVSSVAIVVLPLHGCWTNQTHLLNIQYGLASAFKYVL